MNTRSVQALDYVKNDNNPSNLDENSNFEPTQGLDPNGFQAIDDDDIPF